MTRPLNPWKLSGYKPGQNVWCKVVNAEAGGYAVLVSKDSTSKDNLPGYLPTQQRLKAGEEILATFVCVHKNRILLTARFGNAQISVSSSAAAVSQPNWQEQLESGDYGTNGESEYPGEDGSGQYQAVPTQGYDQQATTFQAQQQAFQVPQERTGAIPPSNQYQPLRIGQDRFAPPPDYSGQQQQAQQQPYENGQQPHEAGQQQQYETGQQQPYTTGQQQYETGQQQQYESGQQAQYNTGPQSQYDSGQQGQQAQYNTGPQGQYSSGQQSQEQYSSGSGQQQYGQPDIAPADFPTGAPQQQQPNYQQQPPQDAQQQYQTGPQGQYQSDQQAQYQQNNQYQTGAQPAAGAPPGQYQTGPQEQYQTGSQAGYEAQSQTNASQSQGFQAGASGQYQQLQEPQAQQYQQPIPQQPAPRPLPPQPQAPPAAPFIPPQLPVIPAINPPPGPGTSKKFQLRRAIDLMMPPIQPESINTFKIADYDLEWLITDLEGGMRTGCVKASSEQKLSRSAMLLYRGRAVGCIYGCKANPETLPTEQSLPQMLADLDMPDAIVSIYDLPENVTLAMSALFLGYPVQRSDDYDARSYMDYICTWFESKGQTACLAITLPSNKATCLGYVYKGQFAGAFYVEDQKFTTDKNFVYELLRNDPNAGVEASILPPEMTSSTGRFGYSLSMAKQRKD